MLILGLTGSIGMGKSTVAAHFKSRGIAVFDADSEVHRLYENEAIPLIEDAFPGTTTEAGVDRVQLAQALQGDAQNFAKLEAIVHPLVFRAQGQFLEREEKRGAKLVVLEIPLLFETGGEEKVDRVVVVSAGEIEQRARVLARPNMSEEKFEHILKLQMPDAEKRKRADYVVDTSGSIEDTTREIDIIIARLGDEKGGVFERWWKQQ